MICLHTTVNIRPKASVQKCYKTITRQPEICSVMINHISSQRVNHLLTQVGQFYFMFHPFIHSSTAYISIFFYFHKPQRTTGLNIEARRDHHEVAVATPAGFGFDTYILTANIWSQVWIRNKMVDSLAPSLYLLSRLHYGMNRKKNHIFWDCWRRIGWGRAKQKA